MSRETTHHDGCALSWFAEGDGPPIVMIQGVGVGANGWRPQIDGLSDRYRCLAICNRGFGLSQPIDGELTVERMAGDVLAVMNAAGWQNAHVIGHSLGGLVAQYVAHKARERVRSLSLLCTFADGAIPTSLSWRMLSIGTRTRIGTRRMRRLAFLELVMPPDELTRIDRDALAERMGALFDHDLADSPPVAMKQLSAMGKANATPFLAGLAGIPTLVVSAFHDPIAPPHAGRAIAAGIAGSRYVEIADASHGVPIHQADRINSLLREHLDEAEAGHRAAG